MPATGQALNKCLLLVQDSNIFQKEVSAFLEVKAIMTGMSSCLAERMYTLDLSRNVCAIKRVAGGVGDHRQLVSDYLASGIEINTL